MITQLHCNYCNFFLKLQNNIAGMQKCLFLNTYGNIHLYIHSQGGVADPPDMKAHLIEKKAQERQFLDQLLNGRILQSYGIPVPIKADLRKYQQVR